MKDDISALRQQLKRLQAQRDSGALSAQAHADAKAPLERKLLQRVLADPATEAGPAPTLPNARPSAVFVGALLAGVLALAVAGYSWTGAPGATVIAEPAAAEEGGIADEQQFAAAVEKLAARLKDEPGNAEGWAMLARSYARLGRHAEAVPAFGKAVALQSDDARLLADYADTLALQNNRSLQGEPTKLLERALKIDPQSPKALALAGTAAFDRKDFKAAVGYWETLAAAMPGDSGFLTQLQGSINQARELAGMPKAAPAQRAAAAPAVAPMGGPATSAARADAAFVQGTVSLSPSVAAQAAPTDTVFIFARTADGPRMPLAIVRHQVKDLPLSFRLDDSTAMAPTTRLSLHPQVVISARVSKSGQAVPAAGDLVGQSRPVSNTARSVHIEINELVKN